MNDEIRAAVSARLAEKHMSRSELARSIGKHPNSVTRALNGLKDGGQIPPIWQDILNALNLELTARPRENGEGKD